MSSQIKSQSQINYTIGTFDDSALTLLALFALPSYVQFSGFVRDLHKVYKTRIWMLQIGGSCCMSGRRNEFLQIDSKQSTAQFSNENPLHLFDWNFPAEIVASPEHDRRRASQSSPPFEHVPQLSAHSGNRRYDSNLMFCCPITEETMRFAEH